MPSTLKCTLIAALVLAPTANAEPVTPSPTNLGCYLHTLNPAAPCPTDPAVQKAVDESLKEGCKEILLDTGRCLEEPIDE